MFRLGRRKGQGGIEFLLVFALFIVMSTYVIGQSIEAGDTVKTEMKLELMNAGKAAAFYMRTNYWYQYAPYSRLNTAKKVLLDTNSVLAYDGMTITPISDKEEAITVEFRIVGSASRTKVAAGIQSYIDAYLQSKGYTLRSGKYCKGNICFTISVQVS